MAIAALAVTGLGAISNTASAQFDLKDTIETVGAMMLADRLGIDPNLVLMAKLGGNSSIYDMAPAFAMSPYTQVPPQQLYAMNSAGLGWDQVAMMSGVPRPTYQTLYSRNQFDSNTIWADEFNSRYGVPQDDLYALRRAGYTWREIAEASVISQDTGRPVSEVLYQRNLYGNYAYAAPTYTRYNDPIYVPARRQTVAYLPPARFRRDNWFAQIDPNRAFYVDADRWQPQRVNVVRRPVYVQWSPVRVIQEPRYVRYVTRPRVLRYEPVFASWDRDDDYDYKHDGKHTGKRGRGHRGHDDDDDRRLVVFAGDRVIRQAYSPLVIRREEPRYAVARRDGRIVTFETAQRAQRFIQDRRQRELADARQDNLTTQLANQRREAEQLRNRNENLLREQQARREALARRERETRRDLPGNSEHGKKHAAVNRRDNLQGRERGERHKAIGGVADKKKQARPQVQRERTERRAVKPQVQRERTERKAVKRTNTNNVNGKRHSAVNRRDKVQGRERGERHKAIGGVGSTQRKATTQKSQQRREPTRTRTRTNRPTIEKRAQQPRRTEVRAASNTRVRAEKRQSGGNVRAEQRTNVRAERRGKKGKD